MPGRAASTVTKEPCHTISDYVSRDSVVSVRGLFDDFQGYRTLRREDIESALANSMIVPDANVLLNLYRYTPDGRNNLLSTLEAISERLWVPHQVLVEFWRNRETVLRDPGGSEKTLQALDGHRTKAIAEIRTWANRVYLPPAQVSSLVDELNSGFERVFEQVKSSVESATADFSRSTADDGVLKALESILTGRVGSELEESEYKAAVREGLRRVAEQEPPGYKDKRKEDARAAGDYIVWEQTLIESSSRERDVLFITADTKEDWWRVEGGERRGPRIELVNELRRRSGQRLIMLRPAQLLEYAKDILAVSVTEQGVRDVELVDANVAREQELLPDGGWTVAGLTLLLVRLLDEAPVQAKAIQFAAINSGFVSREDVYRIGDYAPERSLRGFTRPVNRVAQFVRSFGVMNDDAVDLLWTVYNQDSPEVGWAAGFQIHQAVLPIFAELSPNILEEAHSGNSMQSPGAQASGKATTATEDIENE